MDGVDDRAADVIENGAAPFWEIMHEAVEANDPLAARQIQGLRARHEGPRASLLGPVTTPCSPLPSVFTL